MIRHLIRSSSRPMAGSAPILPMDPAEARRMILAGTAPAEMTVNDSLDFTRCTGLTGTTWRGGTLAHIDSISTLLGRSRIVNGVRLHKAWWLRDIAPDKPLHPCFVAEQDGVFAHGDTAEQAMRDLRFKIARRDFDPTALVETIQERGTVTRDDFRLLTGACETGLRIGMADVGLDPDAEELPLPVVLAKAHGSFGDAFRAHFGEFV